MISCAGGFSFIIISIPGFLKKISAKVFSTGEKYCKLVVKKSRLPDGEGVA